MMACVCVCVLGWGGAASLAHWHGQYAVSFCGSWGAAGADHPLLPLVLVGWEKGGLLVGSSDVQVLPFDISGLNY